MLPQRIRQAASGLPKAPVIVGWLLLVPAAAPGAVVEIHTGGNLSATAEFRPGKPGKPAVLVLHGFLQTREFGIVKSIADSLADEGYTVLSPNLSLGVSRRKNSLDCQALHLHDMDGDVREIQQWVQWLRERGYRKIVGVGHSFGATQLLAWREQYRERDFALIGVSIVGSAPIVLESRPPPPGRTTVRKKPDAGLIHAPLSFCEIYTAPARNYASYQQWDENRILSALKYAGSRTDVILGSEDKFPPPNWGNRLAGTGAKIHRIKNANHFMDGTQEFDMLDTLLGILNR